MCSGEGQKPTVSSEQLLSDLGEPSRALAGPARAAPAAGAQRTRALQIGGVFAGRKGALAGPRSHRRGYRDSDVTGALSGGAAHPLLKHHQLLWAQTC